MKNDPWLEKWMDLLQKESAGGHLLEIGCGSGWDTTDLLAAGCPVIASDVSRDSVTECAQCLPGVKVVQFDIASLLPFADHSMAVILASLSLHFFSWKDTMQIASELRRCIQPGGILLARFNSTHDFHYGVSSEVEIEPGFYQVGARTKRFFDKDGICRFLHDWDIKFLEENVIQRYKNPKCVWEIMAVSPSNSNRT